MFFFNSVALRWGLVGARAVLFSILRTWLLSRPSLTVRPHRGRVLYSAKQVEQNLPRTSNGFQWGRFPLPARAAYGHIAVVGATGSGKTLLQRLLMQSVLPKIGAQNGQRALIYDAKQDIMSLLGGMDLSCPIHLLDPLDMRSVAWDIAADVTSRFTAGAGHR